MSVEHLAVVLHHSHAKGTRKLVLIGVANHDGDGGAWPSVSTLARYAGTEERQVQKHLAALVSAGELAVDVQEGGPRDMPDHKRPNRYRVLVRCPSWCDRSPEHRDTRPTAQRLDVEHRTGEGVSSRTPGVVEDTGGGVVQDTQTIPRTSPPTPPPLDTRPCQDCGQGQSRCRQAQRLWPEDDRHVYTPVTTGHVRAHLPAEGRRGRATR